MQRRGQHSVQEACAHSMAQPGVVFEWQHLAWQLHHNDNGHTLAHMGNAMAGASACCTSPGLLCCAVLCRCWLTFVTL